jgi:hypothetical protein
MRIRIAKKYSELYSGTIENFLKKGMSFDLMLPQYTNLKSIKSKLEQFKVYESEALIIFLNKQNDIEETFIEYRRLSDKDRARFEYSIKQNNNVIFICHWNVDGHIMSFDKTNPETGGQEISFKKALNHRTSSGIFDYLYTHKNSKQHSFNDQPAYFAKSKESDYKIMEWKKDGELHREGGPAYIKTHPTGDISEMNYFINGKPISPKTHEDFFSVKFDENGRVIDKRWYSPSGTYRESFFANHPYSVKVYYDEPSNTQVLCVFAVSPAHGYAQYSEFSSENPLLQPTEEGFVKKDEKMSIASYENRFGKL